MANADGRLPYLVRQFLDGWYKMSNSGVIASTLLALISTTIFVHIQDHLKDVNSSSLPEGSAKADGLLIVAYLSIFLNSCAMIAAFLLSSRIVSVPSRAAQKGISDEATHQEADISKVASFYVNWRWWTPIRYYWIFNLFMGIVSIFAELLLYLWFIEQSLTVKIAVTAISVTGFLPLVVFLLDLAFRSSYANRPAEEKNWSHRV